MNATEGSKKRTSALAGEKKYYTSTTLRYKCSANIDQSNNAPLNAYGFKLSNLLTACTNPVSHLKSTKFMKSSSNDLSEQQENAE
jgi:hypothetical protein